MSIIVNLDVMLAKRKISLSELSERVNITLANLSILKRAKQKPFVFRHWKRFAMFWIANLVIS